MDHKPNKMAVQPIPQLMFKMGLPMVLSMMLQAAYNVVDSTYLARMSSGGVESLIISLCRQVIFVLPPVWVLTRFVTGAENVAMVWVPLAAGEAVTMLAALALYHHSAKKRIAEISA